MRNKSAGSVVSGKIIGALEHFPRALQAAKSSYMWLHYQRNRNARHQRIVLHPEVSLVSPYVWSGTHEPGGTYFFGYFDKSPMNRDLDKLLLHQYQRGKMSIMILDKRAQALRTLGTTPAWNWQQGSQAQWGRSSHTNTVIYNTVDDNRLGCRMVSIDNETDRFIPWPVQALHPSGDRALSLNYMRLTRLSPAYGYAIKVTNFSADQSLDQDGIWEVDLQKGDARLIISIGDLIANKSLPSMSGAEHKVNLALYSPSGSRFCFMHRWLSNGIRYSRLYIAHDLAKFPSIIMDDDIVSHYAWRDDQELLVWGRTREGGDKYYLVNVSTGKIKLFGGDSLNLYPDGHPTFSPDGRWVVTDTYPDHARQQHLILYDTEQETAIELGNFWSPWRFRGDFRCDLHPRWCPDGRTISIDSAMDGTRKNYLLDISRIICQK